MAYHKKEEFSADENELADLARAISYPTRIAILKRIAKNNACMFGELQEQLPLTKSTISQHLQELLKVNLIIRTVEGVNTRYALNFRTVNKFERVLNIFFTRINTGNPKFN